jgi:hypothetical protein
MVPEVNVQTQPEVGPEAGLFYAIQPGALTWIRKRRRIERTYRMSDIRWPELLSLREMSDHHRQSDGKRRKVNLEVGRRQDDRASGHAAQEYMNRV